LSGRLKVKKEEKGNFIKLDELKYLKFNFSFMTTNSNYGFDNAKFVDEHKSQLLSRIFELSKNPYAEVCLMSKNQGFEFIKENDMKFTCKYKEEEFYKSEFRKRANNKYCIMRLYSNNNPACIRCIGKVVSNIFYVMFISFDHDKLYK
jgi:hypothetical protein